MKHSVAASQKKKAHYPILMSIRFETKKILILTLCENLFFMRDTFFFARFAIFFLGNFEIVVQFKRF